MNKSILLLFLGVIIPALFAENEPKVCRQQCPTNYSLRPRNCEDVQLSGAIVSGIYRIFPGALIEEDTNGIEVYCDLKTDKGGWTVFLRQVETAKSLQVSFDRNWNEYVQGFGRLEDSYWLGLENILELTKLGNSELRVDLNDWEGEQAYASYGKFRIGCPNENYTLTVSEYSGSAGDSLTSHNGSQFTTRDRDNDVYDGLNCGIHYGGGWWFSKCYFAHLTGKFSTDSNYTKGVIWTGWKGVNYSLKSAEMKVRSKDFKQKYKTMKNGSD